MIREGRIILAVTIAAALFGVVAAPAVAQNSESAPAAAALMKSKTPAGGTVSVKVANWAQRRSRRAPGGRESGSANWKKVLGALKSRPMDVG